MTIECENCQGIDFQVQNGATFCLTCGTESQEHGQETIVDEETLGAFGEHAASLRSKSIRQKESSKGKSRRRDRYKLSYTSIAIFSYTLTGWVQDAINELDVNPVLNDVVLALWAKYLSKIKMAFTKKPGLSVSPGFRDRQVRVVGRKRLLAPPSIRRFGKKKARSTTSTAPLISDDWSDDSAESRRKRSKAKRKYMESVGSSMSEDDMSTSYVSSSEPDDEESDVTNEDRPEIEEMHLRVLSRWTKQESHDLKGSKTPEKPSLKSVFAIFCLAVLLLEDNKLTLSDLIRFAKNGTIAYDTCSQHVPPVMKIKENYDLDRHTGIKSHLRPLDHLSHRRLMARMGSLLCLKKVDFGGVETALKNALLELSLPKYLCKMLTRSFEKSGILQTYYFFEKYRPMSKMERWAKPIVSVDLKAMAMILFALKYFYGLDDESEYHRRGGGTFDIIDWIKLSKHRAFIACKNSSFFHKYFKELFPEVRLSPTSWYDYLQQHRLKLSELRNVKRPAKNTFYSKDEELSVKLASKFSTKSLQEEFSKVKREESERLRKSTTPLYEFTKQFMENTEDEASKSRFKKLLAMNRSKIRLKFVEKTECHVDPEPLLVLARLPSSKERKPENVVFSNDLKKEKMTERCNYQPLYWHAMLGFYVPYLDNPGNHDNDINNHLLTILPENFTWILRYFSALMDVRPTELYCELLKLECFIMDNDPLYFGREIRCSDFGRVKTYSTDLQYRLSLSA